MPFYFDPNMDPELEALMNQHAIDKARQTIARCEANIVQCEQEIAEVQSRIRKREQASPLQLQMIAELRTDIKFFAEMIAKQKRHIKILNTGVPNPEPVD
jgi:uncharacterized protein YfkK (UPF0435 family)